MKKIKNYDIFVNESIKHLLKSKSEEEIKKLLDKSVDELINMAYLKKIDWLLVYALKNGAKLKDIKYANISSSKEELQDWVYIIFINACQENDIELVKILLDDDIFSPIGRYFLYPSSSVPLVIAYKKGNYEIVKLLFNDERIRKVLSDREIMFLEEKMPELFEQNESITHLLKSKDDKIFLKELDKLSTDRMLIKSAEKGYLNGVKYALEKGADIHIDNDYALRQSCENGHLDVVKFLVEKGANIHIYDNDPLRSASFYGYLDIVKYLVENGSEYNIILSASILAHKNGHLKVHDYLMDKLNQNESIKHLLKPKPKDKVIKDVMNNNEMTPNDKLLNGCKFGIIEIVRYAISQGANITATKNWPIRLAADYNNTEVIKYLLTFNEVDPSDIDNSVFKLACKHNNMELVKILLKDNRVDPTDNIIWNLSNLKKLKSYSLIRFLLKDDRIKNALTNEQYDLFVKFLKKKPTSRLKK